ncbi:MAG: histidine kinase [Clostridia bacterium]|nr:histidine kinase [Clostridia bacterium]
MNSRDIKPFWRKMFNVAIMLYIVSTVLLVAINIMVVFPKLQKEAETNLDNAISLSDKVMYSYLNQFDYIINDKSIVRDLVNIYERRDEYISLQKYRISIEEKVKDFYFSFSGISGIAYRDNDNNFVNVGEITLDNASVLFDEAVDGYENDRQYTWRSANAGDKKYIVYYKNICYFDGVFEMHSGGKMVIFIDEEQVYKESFANAENGMTRMFTIDHEGYICCGGIREYVGKKFDDVYTRKGNFFAANDTKEIYYVKHIPSSIEGWKTVGIIPMREIYDPIILIILSSFMVLLLIVIAALFAFYKTSRGINVPLIRLSEQLKNIENGHYDTIEQIEDETEIGYLYYSFNEMVSKLNKQFNENYILNLKIKEAYIQTLEKQINPHFIFNTLQLIQMITLAGKTQDAFNVCGYFGEVVRFNLNDATEVRIYEEIDNLKNYFKILEFRYYGEFEYTISLPDDIKDFYTIKFLLQPIVENAMQHAFEYNKSKCRIDVLVRRMNDGIVFIIKDNGIGMTKEKAKEVTEYIESESNISKSKSIGLKNTNQRIKLLYGEKYGVRIYSKYGKGTTIMIHIPENERKKHLKEEEQTDV